MNSSRGRIIGGVVLAGVALMLLLCADATGQDSPPGTKMFFAGVVGQIPGGGGNRVLLRWYSLEGTPPFDTFTVYRKEGDKSSVNPYVKLTQVTKIRNINTIRSIFETPGSELILADVKEVLGDISGEPMTNAVYAQKLIEILDGECETCGFTNTMFAQTNWGVAIVEGLGYVDEVGSGIHTYELHAVDEAGADSLIVGRITIDADTITTLPPPVTAVEVPLPGERGHLRACLRWDISPTLQEKLPLSFGFDVYRRSGPHNPMVPFETLVASGVITKVNERPVIVLSATPEGEDPNEVYYFCDDNRDIGDTGPVGEPFLPGEQYTYYAVARDLFGQRGEPSNPVEVIIRDQRAPDVPRNPRTRVVRDSADNRRIQLVWDRNSDDTVSYNVYRYREYNHAGRPGPFPPVDGLTEGLVGSTPQPGSGDVVTYIDTAIGETLHENRAFWYCVSAVDGAFPPNESPLSQPFRGVLFDTVPPEPPTGSTVCVYRYSCTGTYFVVGTDDNVQQASALFWIPQGQSCVRRVVIYRYFGDLDPVQVFDGGFGPGAKIEFEDFFTVPAGRMPYWIFDFYADSAKPCGRMVTAADLGKYYSGGAPIQVTVQLGLGCTLEKICFQDTPGREPHVPIDEESGKLIPVQFDVPRVGDATGVILYRADDCENFHPIAERYFGGSASITLEDFFTPHVQVEACYGLRAFDENYNLSPFFYLQRRILFQAGPIALAPAIKTITSIGERSSPAAQLDWFGPRAGVASYIISFATMPVDEALPRMESRKVLSNLYYQEETSTFTGEVLSIDDDTMTPITPDLPYAVKVIALDYSGNEVESGTKAFTWTDVPPPVEKLEWPIRPLPSIGPGVTAVEHPNYGVLIFVGHVPIQGQTIHERLIYDRPFIIYRKRLDIGRQEYVQISPLIEFIKTDASGMEIQDPFFTLERNGEVYYIDNVALVHGAAYEYKLVTYNEFDELSTVYGPSNRVTITIP